MYEKSFFFFFLNDTATTEIYPLPLHDALPISFDDDTPYVAAGPDRSVCIPSTISVLLTPRLSCASATPASAPDRKSTRLNSSHLVISYAVFCLKKKIR